MNLSKSNRKRLQKNIAKIIGRGYGEFWRTKKRYVVVKGSRGSKKSCTTAIKLAYKMMAFAKRGLFPSVLVIRRYAVTHKDSTFAQLQWAFQILGVSHLWKCTTNPMQMTYKPTGQKILFRGLDEPQKITSITVKKGNLCWVWFEEAFQIENEADFDKIDLSIRGILPEGLYKQIILTLNPWNDGHWIKARFFDKQDDDVLAITRNYDCNEWLGPDDIAVFEKMRIQNPKRYEVEGKGNWGHAVGLIYENWKVEDFDVDSLLRKRNDNYEPLYRRINGLDFGMNDPTVFVAMLADEKNYKIYIYDEFSGSGLGIKEIRNEIAHHGFLNETIYADNEPRTIFELKRLGVSGIVGVGEKTVVPDIRKLQDYEIIIHPLCHEAEIAFLNYAWKTDKNGKPTETPIHEYSHFPDAVRYGAKKLQHRGFSF